VPTDRPFRGLVVTREPCWNAVNGFDCPLSTSFPTTVVSVRQIERLGAVGAHHDVVPGLLTLTGTHSNSALKNGTGAVPGEPPQPDPPKVYDACLRSTTSSHTCFRCASILPAP